MYKTMVILIGLLIAMPGVVVQQAVADPAPINNVVPPCDSSGKTTKPDCKTDSESIRHPPQMPGERDSVIVPPEVPAEGLPHQQEKTPDIDQRSTPQKH